MGVKSKTKKRITLLFLLTLCGFVFSFGVYLYQDRTSMYQYEVGQDYQYKLPLSYKTSIKNGEFALPKYVSENTTFVKIRLETSLLGYFFEPSLTIRNSEIAKRHTFERGMNGVRYLNISAFPGTGDWTIEGTHINIPDQEISASEYKNKNPKEQKILVLAPHPDDAEIAAFGLYSTNSENLIVTITAGDSGSRKYLSGVSEKDQYREKGKIRTWNSISVPLLAGIRPENVFNLGFFSGSFSEMFEHKDKVVEGPYSKISEVKFYRQQNISSFELYGDSSWNSLVSELARILQFAKPDIIVTPHPLVDRHRTHKLTTLALFEAIRKTQIHHGEFYFYTNHSNYNELFPYGEEGEALSLVPYFTDAFYAEKIYSHALSPSEQRLKLFALNAMNDLGPTLEHRNLSGAWDLFYNKLTNTLTGRDESYFRRGVRSNELFYVVKVESIFNDDVWKQLTTLD